VYKWPIPHTAVVY